MLLASLLVLVSLFHQNQALQIQKFETNGYFSETLGTTRCLSHYHSFYFYFNITDLKLSYYKLLNNVVMLDTINTSPMSIALLTMLKENCKLIEDQFAKFSSRKRRSLIDGLGTLIKYITGNPDNNDLIEINKNLEILFNNQKDIVNQMSKYTSFAGHITKRYVTDFKIMQSNLNFSIQAINNMSNIIETQLVIQYNNYMSIKLLNTLQSIERTISLASSGITNLEIISNTELFEIANHLKTIYKQSELVDWNMDHMFTILEFSKFQAVSVRDVITCILYIPILDQSFYQYSRIYPIPDSENKILIPPFKHHLQGARGEFWTDEQCKVFNNQTICVEAPRLAKCSIVNNDNCVYAIISNDYKLYAQLNDGKILLSCKFDLLITEECREEIQSISVRNNVLISSKTNCKIIIDNQIFENAANNVTFKNNLIVKDYKANRMINLQPKHLTDFDSLNEESESIIVPVNLHPLVHITHFSFTLAIIIILCIVSTIMYVFRHRIRLVFKQRQKHDVMSFSEIYQNQNVLQNEDVLS
ncbi:hypothetical protein FQR65_LT07365 [Abscondita terminalis]|nr:hypothetical protein FQR65_LT07365 [Abscondita terminalis]